MASVEMTSKNPMNKPNAESRSNSLSMTFNIAQIKEDMLRQNNGQLSKKMEKQLQVLHKMDESGDGEISLMELIHLEEDKEKVEAEEKKLKRILCGIVLFVIVMLGCMMAMGIAAIEITKESRIRGGAPIATSGKSSSIAPKASTARRLNEPWDKPAPFEAAAPSTPLTAHDVSLAAQYKAEEGLTAKQKQEKHEGDRLAVCLKCREAIDKEISDGKQAPFDSLNGNVDCEKCPLCIFNAGAEVQFAPAQSCPTMPDTTGGSKKIIDQRGILYGIGSEESPISVSEIGVKFIAKTIMDADPTGEVTSEQANYRAYVQLQDTVPTIANGAPRSFVVDCSASGENFEGISKITVKMPGDSADVVLEGTMEVAETHDGFGNEAKFVVPSSSPAVPAKEVTLHADGSISLNKAAQEDFFEANQLSQHQNMDPERKETTVKLPSMDMPVVIAEGVKSPRNMNAQEVAANMPAISATIDPVKGTMTMPSYPAQIDVVPSTVSQEIEYTDYVQCDHAGAHTPCTVNDYGVEKYVTGEHKDADGVIHPIYSLFKGTHVSVTQDASHMKIETMGEMKADDVSGVHMAAGETLTIKNNPEGVPDQMLKEQHSYCHGDMCQDFVEETGASDAIVNMDGSITCGTDECVTGSEYLEKDTIDRNQALPACLPQLMGGATEMHENYIAKKTRKLKQFYRKSGNIQSKNSKHTPHHLLAAHAFRQLAASVSSDDLTMFESDKCVTVEYCHEGMQYDASLSEEDQEVIAKALPGDSPGLNFRRLHIRKRRLAALRHVNNRLATHHRIRRLVRKVHLRTRSIAEGHFNTRRRLMAMVEGAEFSYDLDDISMQAPPFHLDSFTQTALESANDLKADMGKDYSDILSDNLYSAEYYGEEPFMTPGGSFAADPVDIAKSQKDQTCGGAPCSSLETYKILEREMQGLQEAKTVESEAETAVLANMGELANKPAGEQGAFYNDVVLPSLDVLNEATYEVEQQNATLHNSADSFILENNLFKLEEYIVDNMEEFTITEETAKQAAFQAKTACAKDPIAACTPDSFDVDHYLETSSTHAHEVDNPTEIYSDFGEITTAAVATQHVNDIIDTLIEVGANLEAAKNKPSSCGYVSFEKTAAPDGGIRMTRQHSTRTIPSTDAVYRRLKQHDYGRRRRLRGGVRSRGQYSRASTRERVERQMDRHREERGGTGRFSPVDAAFSRTDERMNRSPRDRESNTRSINPPERRVQNSRERRSRETPASRRSASTDRTANKVMEERKPAMSNCRKNKKLAEEKCNGCTTDPFQTAYSNARCIDICNEFRGCDRLVDATAKEMVKARIETSVSLTRRPGGRGGSGGNDRGSRGGGNDRGSRGGGNDRGSRGGGGRGSDERGSRGVQVQIQNVGRGRGRGGEERGYGDDRAVRNARNIMEDARKSRPPPSRERDIRRSETRGSLERRRERSRGSRGRPDPREAAIESDSRLSARRRTNSNTTLDVEGAARRIRNPGKATGSRREAMPDNLPASVMCKENTRDRRNCSGIVSYPRNPRTNPFSITFEHNINGPPEMEKPTKPCPNGHTCTTKMGAKRACKSIGGSWDGSKWDITKGWESGCGKAGKPSKESRIKRRKAASGKNKDKKGRRRRKLLTAELEGDAAEQLGNFSSCSHELKERMCFDLEQDDNGKLSVQFGDLESGEFRLFFELGDSTQTKICLSIDSCGVVILDSATVTGQATFPTRLAKRLANDCLDATGDPKMCCPGTGTMIRDISRSNGIDEFFVCDMSNMNPGALKSPVFDVDVTIRADTTSGAPVVEISDMGHQPMHLTNGISIDYHFMQNFYPYYASLGKFCAGFEVLSDVFVPNCPECSMCENDGTDSVCMKHAGHASACLNTPNCQFDNYTSECHSLPGDDSLPQTLSTAPLPCSDGQAYCTNTPSGDPECVEVKEGKCLNCMDTSAFNDAIRGKRCSTPSGPTCAMQGMFLCQASHECVAYCGSECKPSGNSTGIDGIALTHTSMLLGDPKSHICAIPNPNVCHRFGQIFCEGTQDCVTECNECYSPGKHGVEFVNQRANAGVNFHGKDGHVFHGNASTCKAVTLAICTQQGKKFCKNSFGTSCIDTCAQCDEKPADNNGECVRPKNLPSGKYYCPANGTTSNSCSNCHYDSPYIAKYTEQNESTKTCYQDPNFQLPGYYRCSIHTGKLDVEKDVTHCATECFAVDPDTNKLYAKKVHQINSDKPYRTCEQVNKNSCVNNGMVWCENDQTATENGAATGECQMSCANCYKPVRLDDINNAGTPAEVGYMPLPVNDSNTCKEQTDVKASCKSQSKYWCEGTNSCSDSCYDCVGEVNVWDSTTLSYTMKTEQFLSANEEDGVCEVSCPYAKRNVQYNYFWGDGETYMEEQQSIYCPLTTTCLVPDGFGSGNDPVIIDMMNMYGSSNANPCSACGTFTIQKWHNGNSVCVEATKETCNAQYNRWCPTTRKCLSWSESCEENCPGMSFTPPHYVGHDMYDSGSCMQTKAEVAAKCKNSEFLSTWESPGKYCKSDYWQGCVESCEFSCFSESVSAVDDGTGFCTFQNTLVTTHNEPLDDYIPQYNHTVTLEADGTETETWVEEPQNYTSTDYAAYTEVADPWCNYSMTSVQYCDECAATMDSNMQWTPSQMIKSMDGLSCIWPEKVYGCNDLNAVNYDPYATDLYDDSETCPPTTDTDYCTSCSYSSYNMSSSLSLPEDTLDYYGMPMNLSEPDASMYNYSYMYP